MLALSFFKLRVSTGGAIWAAAGAGRRLRSEDCSGSCTAGPGQRSWMVGGYTAAGCGLASSEGGCKRICENPGVNIMNYNRSQGSTKLCWNKKGDREKSLQSLFQLWHILISLTTVQARERCQKRKALIIILHERAQILGNTFSFSFSAQSFYKMLPLEKTYFLNPAKVLKISSSGLTTDFLSDFVLCISAFLGVMSVIRWSECVLRPSGSTFK